MFIQHRGIAAYVHGCEECDQKKWIERFMAHGAGLKLNTVVEKKVLDGIAIEDRNDYASCRGNVSLLGPQLSHIAFILSELLLPTLIGSPLLHVL